MKSPASGGDNQNYPFFRRNTFFCLVYSHLLPDLDSCYLHRDTGTRFVTRGEDASVFEFPFAALIGYTHPTGDFDGIKYLCGGTLINNR